MKDVKIFKKILFSALAILFFVIILPLNIKAEEPTAGYEGDVPGISSPSVNVSEFSGGASVGVPIQVPPGRNGVIPNLTISYSRGANGWLGVGWNLDLGSIQRSSKFGINYTGTDFVAFKDGSPADLVARADWGTNYYGSKIESNFAKFYFDTTNNKWIVTFKNGMKFYYGSTAASRLGTVGSPAAPSETFKWCLDRVEDSNGNYLLVEYFKDSEIYLSRIVYTYSTNDNPTGIPHGEITFYREARPDVLKYGIGPILVNSSYRLKTIIIKTNGEQKVRAYKLNYSVTPMTSASVLSNIQQYGNDFVIDSSNNITGGSSLPPISFNTNTDDHVMLTNIGETIVSSSYSSDKNIAAGDVNGDKKADFFWVDSTTNTAHVFLNNGNGTFTESTVTDNRNYSDRKFLSGDFNGDGLIDYLFYRYSDGSLRIYISNGNGSFKPVIENNPNTNYNDFELYLGDYNGDGKMDVMWMDRHNNANARQIYFGQETIDGNGNKIFNFNSTPVITNLCEYCYHVPGDTSNNYGAVNVNYGQAYIAVTGDYNGDGKTDYMWFEWIFNRKAVFLSNGDGTFKEVQYAGDNQTYGINNYKFTTGDFNGDGKIDYLWYGNGYTYVYLSKGDGTFADRVMDSSIIACSENPLPLKTGDFNGDGKSDLIYLRISSYDSVGRCGSGIHGRVYNEIKYKYSYNLLLGKGDGTFIADGPDVEFAESTICNDYVSSPGKFTLFTDDLNGNGIQDVLVFFNNTGYDPYQKIDALIKSPTIDTLYNLLSVSNGMGGSKSFFYGYSYEHANTFLPFVFPVVKSVTVDDGLGTNTSIMTYDYYDGLYDYPTREFRGFGKVSSLNPDNVTTTTWYNQDEFLKGRAYKTIQQDASGTLLSQTLSNWETDTINPPYNNSRFAKLTQTRTESYDGQTIFTQKDYTYDSTNGNILTETSSGTGAENLITTTHYTNVGTGADAWLWSPDTITGSGSVSGKMRETYFTYYEDGKGNLHYEEKWLNGETNPRVTYTYDNYGNRKTTTDPKGIQASSIDYDTATNTYPVKVTAAQTGTVSHVAENLAIDYGLGKATSTKDENGNITNSTYDAFGRSQQVNTPDGGQITYEYHTGVIPQYVKVMAKEDSSGNTINSYTYYDGLGRQITKLGFGENGKTIVTRTFYDPMGRVSQSWGPYFSVGVAYNLEPYDVSEPATAVYTCPYGGGNSDQSACNANCSQPGTCPYHSGSTFYCMEYGGSDNTRCNTGCDQDGLSGNNCCPDGLSVPPSGTLSNCTPPAGVTLIPQGYYEKSSYILGIDNATACWGDWYRVYSFNTSNWTCSVNSNTYWDAASCATGCIQTSACSGPNYSCPAGWTLNGSTCSRTNNPGYPWVITYYDNRGRPIEIKSPSTETQSGTASSYITYENLANIGFASTATDLDGNSKKQIKDYLGRVVKVIENVENNVEQNTTYTYNAAGELLTTTDNNGNHIIFTYDTLGRKRSVNDPDRGLWSYTYDANGNLQTQTDARNITVTFNYDNLNRITSRTYSTGKTPVNYTYDNLGIPNGRGKIYSVNNGAATKINNSYDVMGRVLSSSKIIAGDADTYTTQFGYDLTSKLKTITYPDNSTIGYNYYTGTGLIYNVVDMSSGKEYARYSFYEPSGKIGQINHGNGATTRYSYDVWTGRLGAIVSAGPSGQTANDYQRKIYKYTLAGDIREIKDEIRNITFTYAYDKLHRLKTETNNGGLPEMNLTYDALGNIVTKNVGTNLMNYSSYDPVKAHAVKTLNFNGTAYTFNYDNDGNMTTGYDFTDPANVAFRTMTYDEDNNLASVNYTKGGSSVTSAMSYDEGGTRVKKVGSSTTYYVSDVYEVKDGVATKFITAGNLKLAVVSNNVTHYYHNDHLGSSAVMTDATGTVVEKTEYMPFGAVREHTGTSVTNYKYTGQELDPESGLYYYKSRYYDNVLARFISPDSIYSNLYVPQDLNGYTYCGNNPINNVDPDGHSIETFIVSVVVCATISAVMAGHASGGDPNAVLTGAIIGGVAGAVAGPIAGPAGALLGNSIAGCAVAGAAGGAVAGGLNAAVYGGNIFQGMLVGAAIGAATGAVMGAIAKAIDWAVNENPMKISTTSEVMDTGSLEDAYADSGQIANDASSGQIANKAGSNFELKFNKCMYENYHSQAWYRWSTKLSAFGVKKLFEHAAIFTVEKSVEGGLQFGWLARGLLLPETNVSWMLNASHLVEIGGRYFLGATVFSTFVEIGAEANCAVQAYW